MELRLRGADQGWSIVMKLLQKYECDMSFLDVIVKEYGYLQACCDE